MVTLHDQILSSVFSSIPWSRVARSSLENSKGQCPRKVELGKNGVWLEGEISVGMSGHRVAIFSREIDLGELIIILEELQVPPSSY